MHQRKLRRIIVSITVIAGAALACACQGSEGGCDGAGDCGQGGGGGASTGSGGAGGTGAGCAAIGASCCDPYPGDGPNYCEGGLICGAGNQCYPANCDCALGAYVAVCGVDGSTYDATCGRECVPVAIACDGECPCDCTGAQAMGCAPTSAAATPCCAGLQCCQGVPYDAQGECHATCDLRSDRAAKTDVSPADTEQLLESVARLPISTWRYVSDPAPLHVGPMAQDFASELGLGGDPRVIAAVDASGVALASIQALYLRVEQLARENEELRRRLDHAQTSSSSGQTHP